MTHHFYINVIKAGQHNDDINKVIYYLAFIFLLSSIIILSCIAFIRTNVLTNVSIYNYTITQCQIGFYGTYTFLFINKTFIYLILLYRIKLVFQNSMYQYSSITLQLLLGSILFCFITAIILLYWVPATHYNLNTNSNGLVYCSRDDDFHPVILGHKIFVAIINEIFNIIFMYMFISKLHLLRKELVKQYLSDHSLKYLEKAQSMSSKNSNKKSVDILSEMHIPSKVNKKGHVNTLTVESINNLDNLGDANRGSRRLSAVELEDLSNSGFTLEVIASNYKGSNEMEKNSINDIMTLHKLIIKQTILVCITICSSFATVIIIGFIPSFLQQIWIEIAVNTISIWLMFGAANKYWNQIVNICCCCCCYTKVTRYLEDQ